MFDFTMKHRFSKWHEIIKTDDNSNSNFPYRHRMEISANRKIFSKSCSGSFRKKIKISICSKCLKKGRYERIFLKILSKNFAYIYKDQLSQ